MANPETILQRAAAALHGAGTAGYTCTYEDAAQAVLDAAAVPDLLAALRIALPLLEDNARFLREMQAHSGKVLAAFDGVKAVKEALAKAEVRS